MTLEKQQTVVAIGDSVIEGKAALEDKGWVYLFSNHLRGLGFEHSLVNNGSGGNTSEDVRRSLREDCLNHNPDLVILGVGVNDSRFRPSKGGNDVELRRFQENVRYIVEQVRALSKASNMIVVGQAPVIDELVDPYKPDKHYRRALQVPYERVLEEQAKSSQSTFVPIFDEWVSRGDDFVRTHLADGLHPNVDGHQVIEKSVFHLSRFAVT